MSSELQELLATVQLQKFLDLLEDELKITSLAQLKRLKSSDLSQIGMTKLEVERLKKCAKMSGNQGALSKLRKILPMKNELLNGTNGSLTSNSKTAAVNGVSSTSDNGRSHDMGRHPSIEYPHHHSPTPSRNTPPPILAAKVNQPVRELCKRSLSSSVSDRPRPLDHHRHKHEFNPNINVCCKFDSEHPCEHYIDMPPPKRENILQRMHSAQPQTQTQTSAGDRKLERTISCDVPSCSTPMGEVLKTLSGPQEVKVTDSPRLNNEKAPLIQTDPPRVAGTTTIFDNIAAVTESDVGAAGRENPTRRTNHPRTVSESSDITVDRRGSPESSMTGKMLQSQLPKKKKPLLRIAIPGSKESGGIKPLSAADARRIDEAIELATTFALKNQCDHQALNSPRSSGSSKESLSSSVDSPTGHTWFGLRRKPVREEKKSFMSGMVTPKISCDINAIFTPEAQLAYNQLVAKSPGIPQQGDEPVLKAPSSLHDRVLRRHHQRSSLSESDRVPLSASILRLYGRRESGGDWPFPQQRPRSARMKSCGEHSPLEIAIDEREQVNLGLFYHMLKNQKNPNPGSFKRSLSLSEETQTTEETGVKAIYRLSLGGAATSRENNKSCQNGFHKKKPLSPAYDRIDGGGEQLSSQTVLEEVDSPPTEIAPQPPPPPVPPRMPLRKSTLNVKPRQRRFPLDEGLPSVASKTRSMSEAMSRSHPITKRREVPPPREVRSTSGHSHISRSSTSDSPNSSFESDQLNSTQDSDDSVFGPDSPTTITPTVSAQNSFSYRRDGRFLHHQLPTADELARLATTSASTSTLTPTPLPFGGFKSVRFNARDLGIDDKADLFWMKQVNFESFGAESQSETDLTLGEDSTPCRYETSDSVSYEDLMEFALDDGPNGRNLDGGVCDEIRLMRKVLSKDVSVDDCQTALTETDFDVHRAIKLIKLKQLLSTNIADKQQCKQALMFCQWNIQEAGAYLLAPPHTRHTPDILNV